MTGYARADGEDGPLGWTWEAKSVNGRGLEVRCRVPSGLDALEIPAREAVQKRCKRGSINLALTVRRHEGSQALAVNEARLAQLAELATKWHSRLPGFGAATIDGLLALRGVLDAPEGETDAAAAHAAPMLATLERALESMVQARAAEGIRIARTLEARLAEVDTLVADAVATAALQPQARRERLREQVRVLLENASQLPEERLLQEAALLAAKGDVTEEIDRLRAHVAAARDLIREGDGVGRRLDFLCQEFNREANTLCAKAADLALTTIGLKLKSVIEQFREQVQNIE